MNPQVHVVQDLHVRAKNVSHLWRNGWYAIKLAPAGHRAMQLNHKIAIELKVMVPLQWRPDSMT
jgi:hypothetical protein